MVDGSLDCSTHGGVDAARVWKDMDMRDRKKKQRRELNLGQVMVRPVLLGSL